MTAWLDDVESIIVSLVAVAGGVAAWVGLYTWKDQLTGKQQHDLAHRILVLVLRWRDALQDVRNPFMMSSEVPPLPAETTKDWSDDRKHHDEQQRAYQARWEPVNEVRRELYAAQLEAEALWGAELQDLCKGIHTLQVELLANIRRMLRATDPEAPNSRRQSYQKMLDENREVMYGLHDDEDDPYNTELQTALDSVTDYLKTKFLKS